MRCSLTIFLFFSLSLTGIAQVENADSLFMVAHHEAEKANYDTAIQLTADLLKTDPRNADYRLFLGSVYSWKGDYPDAIEILSTLQKEVPDRADVMEALSNVQLWSEDFNAVIQSSDLAITRFPDQVEAYELKKAIALEKLDRDHEAMTAIQKILEKNPKNQDALAIQTILFQKAKNAITASYLNTSFSNPSFESWNVASLEYKRVLKKSAIVGRGTYGSMYGLQATQFEVDWYPKLGPKSYLYVNTGFSGGNAFFPLLRGGVEWYRSFNHHFSASIGSRYLQFKPNIQVALFTGHISYGFRNTELTYRNYFTFSDSKLYLSHLFSWRINNEVKESFVQFDVHYGTVPYNTIFVSNEFNRVNSFRLGIQYQFRIKGSFFLRPIFMYEYEEYFPKMFRNRYNTQLMITKRF